MTADDITFGHSKFEPHTSIHKKHIHKNAEEIMYMKGRSITGVDDPETVIKAGDTVWVSRATVHWFYYNAFDEPCEFIFIYTRKS